MNNSIFFDTKSRYNNLDNTNIVFLTPNQVKDLDIGLDMSVFNKDELNDIFPFVVDSLKEMTKETTIGDVNGSDIEFTIENSDCKVYTCIEINGKYCKLQSEEWNGSTMSPDVQVKMFQRLLCENQITLDDLAAEDIDNTVYKKLVINDIDGMRICNQKLEIIDKLVKEQSSNKLMKKRRETIIKSL